MAFVRKDPALAAALDQAIACCGKNLVAAEVRALLGMFSLESLGRVTTALAAGDSQTMFAIVAELEAIAWWDWPIEKITRHLPVIVAADLAALRACA